MSTNHQTENNTIVDQCLTVNFGYNLRPGKYELLSIKIEQADLYIISVNEDSREITSNGPIIFSKNSANNSPNTLEICVQSKGAKTGKLVDLKVEKIVEEDKKDIESSNSGSNSIVVITIDDSFIIDNGEPQLNGLES